MLVLADLLYIAKGGEGQSSLRVVVFDICLVAVVVIFVFGLVDAKAVEDGLVIWVIDAAGEEVPFGIIVADPLVKSLDFGDGRCVDLAEKGFRPDQSAPRGIIVAFVDIVGYLILVSSGTDGVEIANFVGQNVIPEDVFDVFAGQEGVDASFSFGDEELTQTVGLIPDRIVRIPPAVGRGTEVEETVFEIDAGRIGDDACGVYVLDDREVRGGMGNPDVGAIFWFVEWHDAVDASGADAPESVGAVGGVCGAWGGFGGGWRGVAA